MKYKLRTENQYLQTLIMKEHIHSMSTRDHVTQSTQHDVHDFFLTWTFILSKSAISEHNIETFVEHPLIENQYLQTLIMKEHIHLMSNRDHVIQSTQYDVHDFFITWTSMYIITVLLYTPADFVIIYIYTYIQRSSRLRENQTSASWI